MSVASTDDLVAAFDIEEVLGEDVGPSWNVAPTDSVRAVTERGSHDSAAAVRARQLRTVLWGLVPSWANDRRVAAGMINARIETVATKPAFRSAFARRRCLLPAAGYYEWCKTEGRTVPYFLHDPDGDTLAFAGLYEVWRDPEAPADDPNGLLWTCTIITRAATDRVGQIHDRSPVVVPAGLHGDWLDCSEGGADRAGHLLQSLPPSDFAAHPVSTAVGNVRNNGPELVDPVAPPAPAWQDSLDLGL